jgi:peptide/nickel transport system permease protein
MSLVNFIYKKTLYVLLILITVILTSFFLVRLIGDPVTAAFGQKGPTPEQRQILEKELGLDESLSEQLKIYLKKVLQFDFGNSYQYKTKALEFFWKGFKTTLLLTISSCIFGSIIGIFFGSLSALWQNTKKNFLLEFIFLFLSSTPSFIIGFILQYYLAYRLYLDYGIKLFPISGSYFLAILTLSLIVSGRIFKITNNNMIESLKQPYIITAYAKGLPTGKVVFKHALKNALIPILANIGLMFVSLIGGAVITEFVFDLYGIGQLTIKAFEDRDYPIIQCCIILLAIFISIFNLLLDSVYFWLNPKINPKK